MQVCKQTGSRRLVLLYTCAVIWNYFWKYLEIIENIWSQTYFIYIYKYYKDFEKDFKKVKKKKNNDSVKIKMFNQLLQISAFNYFNRDYG